MAAKERTRNNRNKVLAVAQDVLLQLKTGGKYYPTEGVYVRLQMGWRERATEIGDLKTFLQTEAAPKSCTVCALGACFLSYAGIVNEVRLQSGYGWTDVHSKLSDILTSDQISLIESAFETCRMGQEQSPGQADAAVAFGRRYRTPRTRLAAVMNNIIANGGKFVPPQRKKKAVA